jgi:manganese efflux pump family protein
MSFVEVLFIAVGLAMDAFAVALGVGTMQLDGGHRPAFRLSFHFGLFQFLMPILGWLAGTSVAGWVSAFDHWIAFGLLAFVGGRMIQSGMDPDGECFETDPTRGRTLVMLSVATSIDAFAIGLGLAMLQVNVIYPSSVIGVVAAALTLVGLRLGSRLGACFGKRMEVVGGLILIGIGLRVVITHLLG